MAEINITPFTDVLLVLLIIFMLLAALAAPPGFQKSFDKCNAPCGGGPLLRPILVEVATGPHVFVNGIDAIIKVLDAGRLAGDDDVGLVVQ